MSTEIPPFVIELAVFGQEKRREYDMKRIRSKRRRDVGASGSAKRLSNEAQDAKKMAETVDKILTGAIEVRFISEQDTAALVNGIINEVERRLSVRGKQFLSVKEIQDEFSLSATQVHRIIESLLAINPERDDILDFSAEDAVRASYRVKRTAIEQYGRTKGGIR